MYLKLLMMISVLSIIDIVGFVKLPHVDHLLLTLPTYIQKLRYVNCI